MIEEAKAVAQRLRSPLFPSEDNLKVAATIDALVQENLRLAGEVANRNRRALEGDEATKALNKAHDYYESKLLVLRAEAEQYLSDWKACTAMNRELLAEVERLKQEHRGCACRWDADDNRVATCDRHQGWLDVIQEWADRAKEAEAKLKQEQANEIVSIEGMPVGMGNEPEQAKPVAWMNAKRDMSFLHGPYNKDDIPLYTAPQGQTELLKQALELLDKQWKCSEPWSLEECQDLSINIKQHLGEAT